MARNLFERTIEFVSPSTALKRSSARQKLKLTTALSSKQRSYDAATGGRLDSRVGRNGFANNGAWMTSADTENYLASYGLRDRSRDLYRNNPHYKRGVDSLVNNLVGNGIRPRPVHDDDAVNDQVKALFEEWSRFAECDADGQLDFYGLQTLACRAMIADGEFLIRRRFDLDADGVPLRLQALEADFLDTQRNGNLSPDSFTVQGVEISKTLGRRLNYWMYSQHPGTMFLNTSEHNGLISEQVPASEVLHVYAKLRTQARGTAWFASSMMSLQHLADYEEAEIVRKKIEACNVAIVTTVDDEEPGLNPEDGIQPGVYDGYGQPIERFEPGMIGYNYGGKEVKFNTPAAIGGYNEFKVSTLRSVAAGFGIPYEVLSGDYSQVNFTSARAALLDFRRFVSATQRQILVPMMLQPIWDWFIESAYLAGKLTVDYVPVKWSFPKYDYVNPGDDVAADLMALRAGLKSYHDVISEYGYDPDEVLGDIKKYQDFCRETGVVLDSNPADVSGKGVAQKNEPGKAASAPGKIDHEEDQRSLCLKLVHRLMDDPPSDTKDEMLKTAFETLSRLSNYK